MNHNIIYIIIAWSLLAFVGYNVLSAEATTTDKQSIQKEMCVENYEAKWKDGKCEFGADNGPVSNELEYEDDLKDSGVYEDYSERNNLKEKYLKELVNDDDNINRENADYFCDASEDYVKNKKQCDKLYDKVEKQEEKAAQEDAICDNEDADTTDIKLCMSEDRLQQAAFNIGKDECKEANGEWKKDRCTYYEDEQAKEEPVIEDWKNTVVSDEEQQRYQEDQEYQQYKYEQLAKPSSPAIIDYEDLQEADSSDEVSEQESDDSSEPEEEQEDEPEQEKEEDDNSDSESEQDSE